MTIELAHGLNFWSASRYLYDVIPSTSHMNLRGQEVQKSSSKQLRGDLDYRLSSPDWPGPRVTFFNSKMALRTLTTILDTSSVPRVLVKISSRM